MKESNNEWEEIVCGIENLPQGRDQFMPHLQLQYRCLTFVLHH